MKRCHEILRCTLFNRRTQSSYVYVLLGFDIRNVLYDVVLSTYVFHVSAAFTLLPTTMFFIKELTHTILLHPSYFGPRMLTFLENKLFSDVEGTCSGQFGYIIAVVSILDIGKGMVLSGSGQAEFITRYRAIVFKPFKGEVVDGVVNNVNKMGFFADVGPLSVFVSHQLIHPGMRFDPNSNPPSFASDEQIIERNTRVRLKIVGTRVDATEIFAIGTIKEDHLGVID